MLNIAVRAARNAGDIIVRSLDNVTNLAISHKGKNDYVTEVDKKAEQEIINVISKAFPDHAFLGEESGASGQSDHIWIIDPLDGTTNFLHGFPQFAVSIALQIRGRLDQAVVYDPLTQELFTASRGAGAMLNNRRIRVTPHATLTGSLLGTGFPFKHQQHFPAYQDMFKALFIDSAGIRRAGAAALDLAYVAAGRLDGFWEIGLQPWDMAAGVLLIQEAGGVITDFSNSDNYMKKGNVIASNIKLHPIMYEKIEPFITKSLQ